MLDNLPEGFVAAPSGNNGGSPPKYLLSPGMARAPHTLLYLLFEINWEKSAVCSLNVRFKTQLVLPPSSPTAYKGGVGVHESVVFCSSHSPVQRFHHRENQQ